MRFLNTPRLRNNSSATWQRGVVRGSEGSPLRRWGALLEVRMSMKTEASVPFLCSPAAYRALASLSASSSFTPSVLSACKMHSDSNKNGQTSLCHVPTLLCSGNAVVERAPGWRHYVHNSVQFFDSLTQTKLHKMLLHVQHTDITRPQKHDDQMLSQDISAVPLWCKTSTDSNTQTYFAKREEGVPEVSARVWLDISFQLLLVCWNKKRSQTEWFGTNFTKAHFLE